MFAVENACGDNIYRDKSEMSVKSWPLKNVCDHDAKRLFMQVLQHEHAQAAAHEALHSQQYT